MNFDKHRSLRLGQVTVSVGGALSGKNVLHIVGFGYDLEMAFEYAKKVCLDYNLRHEVLANHTIRFPDNEGLLRFRRVEGRRKDDIKLFLDDVIYNKFMKKSTPKHYGKRHISQIKER